MPRYSGRRYSSRGRWTSWNWPKIRKCLSCLVYLLVLDYVAIYLSRIVSTFSSSFSQIKNSNENLIFGLLKNMFCAVNMVFLVAVQLLLFWFSFAFLKQSFCFFGIGSCCRNYIWVGFPWLWWWYPFHTLWSIFIEYSEYFTCICMILTWEMHMIYI